MTGLAIAAGVMGTGGILAMLSASGIVLGALAGTRLALITRVLPKDAYLLGRSTLDIAGSGMQVAGYAAGGGLIALLGAPRAMWSAVALATTAAGLLAGTAIIGRWLPARWRTRAALPLYLLLALPYLAFAAHPPWWLATTLVTTASFGYAGTLCIQQRFISVVPEDSIGQGLALASAGMLSAQGLAAYLAGAVAELTSPGIAIAAMGAASAAATIVLLYRAPICAHW